jgi:hypothetical protein
MIGTTKATGNGALSLEVAPGYPWQLEEIRVHLNAPGGSGDLTATLDSALGSAYDTNVLTQDMTAVEDLVFAPEHAPIFDKDDKLNIAWTNAGGKTYGIEVKHRAVYA